MQSDNLNAVLCTLNFKTLYHIISALNIDANLIFSNSTSEYPEQAKWFAALIKDMSYEEKLTVIKFLSNLSRIVIQSRRVRTFLNQRRMTVENSDL